VKTFNGGDVFCRESPSGKRLRLVFRDPKEFVPRSVTLNPWQAIRFAAQIQRLANKISERNRRGSK
jgi:hypothetical protein